MKQISLFLLGLIITILTNGQTIKIQTGTSLSNLAWSNSDIHAYEKTLTGYSFFAGTDFLNKKYFNLSSNIGFLRKGGKGGAIIYDINGNPVGETSEKAKFDYFSFNSTIDLKYPIKDKINPFISFGPRFDYLLSYYNNEMIKMVDKMDGLEKCNIGLILGTGFYYDFTKFQFGLLADYYFNFKNIADWPVVLEFADKTFTINLTIGYKLE
jgi:hypothetical protein